MYHWRTTHLQGTPVHCLRDLQGMLKQAEQIKAVEQRQNAINSFKLKENLTPLFLTQEPVHIKCECSKWHKTCKRVISQSAALNCLCFVVKNQENV